MTLDRLYFPHRSRLPFSTDANYGAYDKPIAHAAYSPAARLLSQPAPSTNHVERLTPFISPRNWSSTSIGCKLNPSNNQS